MSTSEPRRWSFDDRDTRLDAMHRTIETWLTELVAETAAARASQAFTEWLDVHSRFTDYSSRNTLLIARQRPDATRVAGYRTWQTAFGRQVREGEQAIWIWAPIVARQCPDCGNAESYHERSNCEYDETPPDEWSRVPVGFKPVPVFDVSQTDGDPLPALDTAPRGEGDALCGALVAAAGSLGVTVEEVPADAWVHGEAMGICRWASGADEPTIQVRADLPAAARAGTLVHEYAHALCHGDEGGVRAQREVEAEAVAYVVGRRFGLDVHRSSFYLAAWSGEPVSTIAARLERISRTARTIGTAIEASASEEPQLSQTGDS